MPAARNGDFLTQVLIAVWLGVSHWSKPSPRKLPGVTGLVAAVAGASERGHRHEAAEGGREQGDDDRRGPGKASQHRDSSRELSENCAY